MGKSMYGDGKNQQLSFFTFSAESRLIAQTPVRKPKSRGKVKRKRLAATYTCRLISEAPTVPTDRVPTSRARGFFCVKRMRPGLVYERQTSYGGKWIAVWAGINPENCRESLWDIHLERTN